MKLRQKNRSRVLFDVIAGAAAGGAATWLMGRATTFMYDHQDPAARRREEEVRGNKDAYVRAAEQLSDAANIELSEQQTKKAGMALHWTLGVGTGALYGWLRHRKPELAAGYGLLFGTAFFLLIDEGANTLLRTTPPPQRFPWQAHARGLAGHLVYGATAESLLRTADRVVH